MRVQSFLVRPQKKKISIISFEINWKIFLEEGSLLKLNKNKLGRSSGWEIFIKFKYLDEVGKNLIENIFNFKLFSCRKVKNIK